MNKLIARDAAAGSPYVNIEIDQTTSSQSSTSGVNFNATGDAITFTGLPTKYVVNKLVIYGWSATPGLLLTATLRDAPSGAGNSLVGSISGLNAVVTSTALGLVLSPLAAVLGAARTLTSSSLYLNISAANGTALTASAKLFVTPLE